MSSWRESTGKFRYQNSPLIEALCEFGFAPSGNWNWELVAQLQGAFEPDYPERKDQRTLHAELETQSQELKFLHGERIRFENLSQGSMVQIAPNTLTINELKPYSGWDHFKPKILKALKTYQQVVGESPFLRAHLRYINRIELSGPMVELGDWLEFSFRQPQVMDLPGAASFAVAASYAMTENSVLRVEVSAAPSTENIAAVMLDLEYISRGECVLSTEAVVAWLEEAHSCIESTWLGSITEPLHKKYEPEAIG